MVIERIVAPLDWRPGAMNMKIIQFAVPRVFASWTTGDTEVWSGCSGAAPILDPALDFTTCAINQVHIAHVSLTWHTHPMMDF
jgi:hypothetical protein